MKRLFLSFALLVSLVLFIACSSEPKIDMRTQETAITSIEEVKNSLSEEDQKAFAEAVVIISLKYAATSVLTNQDEETLEILRDAFHGLTGKEVIKKAADISDDVKGNVGKIKDGIKGLGDTFLKNE